MHIVASRQTATATSILRVLLTASGKEIRLKQDNVSNKSLFSVEVELKSLLLLLNKIEVIAS